MEFAGGAYHFEGLYKTHSPSEEGRHMSIVGLKVVILLAISVQELAGEFKVKDKLLHFLPATVRKV